MAPASLSLSDAWERFGCFHDSAIRRAEFYLRQPRRLTVDLDAWEPGELADTGIWMDGRFRFDDVREYRLWEQNWAIEVIFEAGWAELDDRTNLLGSPRVWRHPGSLAQSASAHPTL
jgi:hypothetical protein